MNLFRIAVSPWALCPEEESDVDAQCDFYSLKSVEEQKSQTLVEDIQLHDVLESCPGAKMIFNNDLRLSCSRDSEGYTGDRVSAHATLAEWIPITTESVVADAFQAGMSRRKIGNFHSPGSQKIQLSCDTSVRFGVRV